MLCLVRRAANKDFRRFPLVISTRSRTSQLEPLNCTTQTWGEAHPRSIYNPTKYLRPSSIKSALSPASATAMTTVWPLSTPRKNTSCLTHSSMSILPAIGPFINVSFSVDIFYEFWCAVHLFPFSRLFPKVAGLRVADRLSIRGKQRQEGQACGHFVFEGSVPIWVAKI